MALRVRRPLSAKTLGLMTFLGLGTALMLFALVGTAHAGSCLVSINGTSPWKQVPRDGYLELRRAQDTLRVFCTSREKPVSKMELLAAAKMEEPEEAYCCNRFGSFNGFESREADGHQEWWLRKDQYIVHIISSRTVPKWSAGADVEPLIDQLTIK
jgi:hypothetical protein